MKKKIVIADDNLNCSKNISKALQNNLKDIEISGIALDGEETLKMVSLYNPDFLILDLNLPKKSGLQVLKELRPEDNCRTKIIIISGENSMINQINLINYIQISNILIKPFKISILCQIIKTQEVLNNQQIFFYIDDFLHKFNFNFTSIFYNYLKLCIYKSLKGNFF